MSKTISIPVTLPWEGGQITRCAGGSAEFPNKCVYCGRPKETVRRLDLEWTEKKGDKETKCWVKPQVPYCAQHARESVRNTIILIVSWLMGAIIGISVIWPVGPSLLSLFDVIAGESWQGKLCAPAVISVGMLAAGALMSRIVQIALSPFLESLRDQPLIASVTGSGLLGMRAKFTHHRPEGRPVMYMLDFTFTNDEFAAEFEQLNAIDRQERTLEGIG